MRVLNIIVSSMSGAKISDIKDKYDPSRVAKREKQEAFNKTPEGLDKIAKQQSENAEINNVKVGSMAVNAVVGLAVQFGKNMLQYKLTGIQYETGDSNYAAQVQERYSDTMSWVSFGGSIAMGALAGASLGPIGAAVGASVAAIGGGINMAFRNAEETRKLNYDIWQDSVKVDYNKARSNINIYGGGRLR